MANTIKGKVFLLMPTQSKEHNDNTYQDRDIVLDCSTFDQITEQLFNDYN